MYEMRSSPETQAEITPWVRLDARIKSTIVCQLLLLAWVSFYTFMTVGAYQAPKRAFECGVRVGCRGEGGGGNKGHMAG